MTYLFVVAMLVAGCSTKSESKSAARTVPSSPVVEASMESRARHSAFAETVTAIAEGNATTEFCGRVIKRAQTSVGCYEENISDLTPLADLTALRRLFLNNNPVSDLTPLKGLAALNELYIVRTQVRDLTPLADLTGLEKLALTGTQVSDLMPLTGLTGLKWLSLQSTQVSDLTPLTGLTALRWLYLGDTQVSDADVEKLKVALPNLDIIRQVR